VEPENTDAEELSPQAEELPLGARISAVLLAAGKPVALNTIAKAVKEKKGTVEAAIDNLASLYKDEIHGFSLSQVQGGYQFRTAPGAAAAIREMIPPKAKRLSRAAAETLAVIAYKQPIQRAEIEAIRGVDALPTLKTLLDARVIRTIGRDEDIGKPALYATTETFLERFGLNDLTELPTIPELRELDAEPGEPPSEDENLSATTIEGQIAEGQLSGRESDPDQQAAQ